jgi:transcriptional regulator with XRE-family HTH domain
MNATDLIRALRGAGLSQTEISRRTNIPQPRLSRWESGEVPEAANDALKLHALHQQVVVVALKAMCDLDGVDMGEWIEAQLVPVIKKRIHDATVLAAEFQRLGITGNGREKSGAARS